MALILSIETSTRVCSIAIHNDGELLALEELFVEKSHSGQLALAVQHLLYQLQLSPGHLSAVAVSKGPGSYTGLRIGVSTAKGLCYALNIPLISVGTLEALAFRASSWIDNKDLLCPMIDARRMEVYCLLTTSKLEIVQPVAPVVINKDSFSDYLSKTKVWFFGNGASKCRPVLGASSNARFADGLEPGATAIGQLAYRKWMDGEVEDLAYFEPFYLKAYQAGKPKPVF